MIEDFCISIAILFFGPLLLIGFVLSLFYIRVAINEGVEEGWLRLFWAVIVIIFFWPYFYFRPPSDSM